MSVTQLEKNFKLYSDSVDFVIQRDNFELGHELYNIIKETVLKSEVQLPDELSAKYKALASRLRAHIYRRFSTRDIPKVFKNDIAHVLYRRSYDVIKGVSIYLDRFKVGDDFARQQKNLVNNLLENKQRLTENSIVVDNEKKVSATVGNWIKYFYRKVGGQQTMNRIKIAEFFSKDSNILKLSKDELHKVKNLIQLQEYLRRPTDELRQELLEIMIDIGDGRLAVFEDGDFSILFGLEEQSFYAKNSGKDTSVKGLSEVEALVRQTKAQRPKRTELKPISSSVEKEVNRVEQGEKKLEVGQIANDIQQLQSEDDVVSKKADKKVVNKEEKDLVNKKPASHKNEPKKEKKKKESSHEFDNLFDTQISQKSKKSDKQTKKTKSKASGKKGAQKVEEKKSDKSAHEIVHDLLETSKEDQKQIDEVLNKLVVDNFEGNVLKFFGKPDKFTAIALLQFIAKENLWGHVHELEAFKALLNGVDMSDNGKKVAAVIHIFLEKHGIMKADESARIAAQLTNSIHTYPEYKEVHLVYFDMGTKSFHWYVNL